jgi:uncharacterized protein (DUF427 family)
VDGAKAGHTVEVSDVEGRLRVLLGGEVVADTTRAKVLHETFIRPRWYIPADDVRAELLEASDHSTHCPFKGDASYKSVRAGEGLEENIAWFYPEPLPGVEGIRDHLAFYDERDQVQVELDGETVA